MVRLVLAVVILESLHCNFVVLLLFCALDQISEFLLCVTLGLAVVAHIHRGLDVAYVHGIVHVVRLMHGGQVNRVASRWSLCSTLALISTRQVKPWYEWLLHGFPSRLLGRAGSIRPTDVNIYGCNVEFNLALIVLLLQLFDIVVAGDEFVSLAHDCLLFLVLIFTCLG